MLRACALSALLLSIPALAKPPKLTLVISVDALSSDLLMRTRPKLKNGLGKLIDQGAWFPDTRYEYAEVHTATGHATLATGANPWRHGVIANRTVNRATGKQEAILSDSVHPVLEVPLSDMQDASPELLMAETVGDRLRLTTYGQAKVVSLSLKARAAIAMGGRLGQAWWYSESVGKFVTGTYYAKEFPAWVKAFNEKKPADAAFGKTWTLSLKSSEYSGEDDRPYEEDFYGLGKAFPHQVTGGLPSPGANYYAALAGTPFGADLLVQFAKAALDGEKLGRDDVPDMLWVSFSNTDHIYHSYGPFSWEMQDTLLRLDKSIGDLVSAAERAAGGRSNLVVVLAADHGGAAIPEEWAAAGLPSGRVNPVALQKGLAGELQARFGAPLVAGVDEGGVFLQDKTIADKRLDGAVVRRAVAAWLMKQPGIALALAKDDLPDAGASTGYPRAMRLGYYPERSGDVLFMMRPYYVLTDLTVGTMHGAPYSYDNQVSAVFSGRNVKSGVYPQRISATDVAATLSALLEIPTPAQAEGSARAEIISR